MKFYDYNNNILIAEYKYSELTAISEDIAKNKVDTLYALNKLNPKESRRSFHVDNPGLMFIESEGLNLIDKANNTNKNLPNWILEKIDAGKVASINTEYPNWYSAMTPPCPLKWKINVIGLGDVGSTLITGLRLLGGSTISEIGIFDLDKNKISRNLFECNQILSPFSKSEYPDVTELHNDELFDCDMFVFCVTAGVPPLGTEKIDVRMAQFLSNSKIIDIYAKTARASNFKGIFAVVSDPVDLLCKSALLSSNTTEAGIYDYKGLLPEQIQGYGLGVMNARATYYSKENPNTMHYAKEGRAFGPHGDNLIIADSITNYNPDLSLLLTDKAIHGNIDVRNTGYKPYIAPALSSGSLSIIDTILGNWHYSSTFMGRVFMGAKNRLTPNGIDVEQIHVDPTLKQRLIETYERLSEII